MSQEWHSNKPTSHYMRFCRRCGATSHMVFRVWYVRMSLGINWPEQLGTRRRLPQVSRLQEFTIADSKNPCSSQWRWQHLGVAFETPSHQIPHSALVHQLFLLLFFQVSGTVLVDLNQSDARNTSELSPLPG